MKKEDFLESLKTDLDNQHNEETEKIYYREEESNRIKDIINTNTITIAMKLSKLIVKYRKRIRSVFIKSIIPFNLQ